MKKAIYRLGLWSLLMTVFLACDDEAVVEDTVASFQFEAGDPEFLTITFTNFSTNYVSSAWTFGNGETSTEESPAHAYAEAGSYEVTLTVTSDAGVEATRTQTVEVEDPNAKLTLLTGIESKTWSLVRAGVSMYHTAGWAGLQNDASRPCYYDDTFTFNRDGSYEFNDAGTFWAEYGIWNNAGCDVNSVGESCFEATAANMVNECGDDVSAWLSGTHAYTYNATDNKITLTGEGAWMGLPGLGTAAQSITPDSEVTFNANVIDGGETGVDSLKVQYDYEGISFIITYVSYNEGVTAPEILLEAPTCEPLAAISPVEISHTFASNETDQWVLLQPFAESAAGLELSVDDPTDAAATKVGKYIRNAGVQYQELQFNLDPANAINFENLSTITMEVYMPSSNDYSGALTDNVFIGIGATNCPPDWFTDQHEYHELAVAKDEWVTVTFNLDAPSYVGVPANGATVYDRNDMDMIYIAIGGGGHEVGAEFYMRNLSIK